VTVAVDRQVRPLDGGAPLDSFDLREKSVVITGGSRGLGKAMTMAFAATGAEVTIASRNLKACRELAEEVESRYGVPAHAVACNVGRWEECEELVESVYAERGRVDVLVNNAGMSPRYDSLTEVSADLFDKVVAVNLRGPFVLSAQIGSRMAAGEGGRIINISSVAARLPSSDALPYAAAKAGLNTLTKGFAEAFGPKVSVNAISAGPFLTDVSDGWDPEMMGERLERKTMLRRAGVPDEIVGLALYLASPASSFCTASVFDLDGGST
jgi:NAD(P)-dependent dehydrogenase (short-subunit alcohol dehydrogenase family)